MTCGEMKTNAFALGEWEKTIKEEILRCAYYADRWPRWEWRLDGVRIDETAADRLLTQDIHVA